VPAPVTANTVTVTQQAQQLFVQNTDELNQVRRAVDSVICQLTNTGMDPVSIDQLTAGLQTWNTYLDDIITTSQWMAETLGVTWQRILKNEQDNTDLAAGLTLAPEPPGQRMKWSHPTGATVAPGQTIRLRETLVEPPPQQPPS
jgi:hypothetical protein